jgi:hypothetical protein
VRKRVRKVTEKKVRELEIYLPVPQFLLLIAAKEQKGSSKSIRRENNKKFAEKNEKCVKCENKRGKALEEKKGN